MRGRPFDRRQFIAATVLPLAGSVLDGVRIRAAQAPATAFLPLRRGVGLFTGPGGTIAWLATPDGIAIVDSQFPSTAQPCIDGLRQRSRGPVQLLINTHHHGDHTAGNPTFRPVVGRIVQQERCAQSHRALVQASGAAATAGLADVTFTDKWSMTIGDEVVSAAYFGPAHTGGDALIAFEQANVVHLGDLVFNRIPPFIDRPAGASVRSWIGILGTVARSYPDALFVFGHGKEDVVTGSVRDVAYFRDYLTAAVEFVEKGIAAGRSAQDISSAPTLPGFREYVTVAKTYSSPVPLFTLAHVLGAIFDEITAR